MKFSLNNTEPSHTGGGAALASCHVAVPHGDPQNLFRSKLQRSPVALKLPRRHFGGFTASTSEAMG